jgi:medium-chain acyl-[acyl-carrier-protein] hydrolase
VNTPWLIRSEPRQAPLFRLLLMPNAGGGPAVFRSWASLFGPEVERCVLRLPGREGHHDTPPCRSVAEMVDGALDSLASLPPAPLALFGHSMGALVAYELARALRQAGTPVVWLGVAARRPPQHPRRPEALLRLPDHEFVMVLNARYGGIPAAVAGDPDLLAHYTEILRADLAVIDGYTHRPGEPLACPVAAFGGRRDPDAGAGDLPGWQEVTTGPLAVHLFDGGHFFLHEHRAAVAGLITEGVRSSLPRGATVQ